MVAEAIKRESLYPFLMNEGITPVSPEADAHWASTFEWPTCKHPRPAIGTVFLFFRVEEAHCIAIVVLPFTLLLTKVAAVRYNEGRVPARPSLCQGTVLIYRHVIPFSKQEKGGKPNDVRGSTE